MNQYVLRAKKGNSTTTQPTTGMLGNIYKKDDKFYMLARDCNNISGNTHVLYGIRDNTENDISFNVCRGADYNDRLTERLKGLKMVLVEDVTLESLMLIDDSNEILGFQIIPTNIEKTFKLSDINSSYGDCYKVLYSIMKNKNEEYALLFLGEKSGDGEVEISFCVKTPKYSVNFGEINIYEEDLYDNLDLINEILQESVKYFRDMLIKKDMATDNLKIDIKFSDRTVNVISLNHGDRFSFLGKEYTAINRTEKEIVALDIKSDRYKIFNNDIIVSIEE